MGHRKGPLGQLGMAISLTLVWATARPAIAQPAHDAWPMTAAHVVPKEFGIQDETRTVISAVSFQSLIPGVNHYEGFGVSASFGRYCTYRPSVTVEYYATLDLPAGAVIDYVGVNNTTDTDGVMGVALWQRDRNGSTHLLVGNSFPAHSFWDTDVAGPLAIPILDHRDKELLIQVEQNPSPNFQFFAWVEIWWHRTVSPPPATASFGDVPPSHPFFQFIEALKASGITSGCGNGTNFCPDSTLTRGQMAAFLARALGLHWPN